MNNWTPSLLSFILFHDCWNLQSVGYMDAPLKMYSLLASVSSTQLVTSKV